MNKSAVYFLSLFVFVAGCTTTRGAGVMSECSPYTMPGGACGGDKSAPEVRITKAANKYVFTPGKVCAEPGSTITFKLLPPPQNLKGTAAIVPKDPGNTWLTGSNWDDEDEIKVTVPEWVVVDDYDYAFLTSTGNCVDPRVEVTR